MRMVSRHKLLSVARGLALAVAAMVAAAAPGIAIAQAQDAYTPNGYVPEGSVIVEPLPPPADAAAGPERTLQDPLPNAPGHQSSPGAGGNVPALDRGTAAAPAPTGAPQSPEDLQKLIESVPQTGPAPQASPERGENESLPTAPFTFPGAPVSPRMTWHVKNPFRFFADPAATELHRRVFEQLEGAERRNPVLAAERRLAARNPKGWAADLVDATCWNTRVNKHTCDNRSDYLSPKKHRVVIKLEGVAEADTVSCQWTAVPRDSGINTTPPESALKPCGEPLNIDVPYPAGTDVSVSVGGVLLQKATVKIDDLLIVGLGDSFASGEGNPDLPVKFSRERSASYGDPQKEPTATGYPARDGPWKQIGDKAFIEGNARWVDQACHRSLYSHQLRAALQLAIEAPHRAVTYVGLACSGAEITDGLFLRYKGNEWVPNPPELSQISAAAQAQCDKTPAEPQDLPEAYHIKGAVPELGGLVLLKCPAEQSRKIDLVFVSIGGNDIGFARLLANAILTNQSTLRKLGGWFGQVHGQSEAKGLLDTLDERYKALNRALHYILHIPWAESDRILLTGYPGMALLGDGSHVCPDGTAGMDVVGDFRLSAQKAREGVWISDKLNRIMKASAQKHGWTFVEHHRRSFIDRGICAGFTDNAFSIADDLRLPRKIDGKWQPYNPADYPAYAKRQRWFRTPNDAFLTGNFHVAASLLQKALNMKSLSYFQLVLAATYSGAFHPTAEGHAAIADAVVEQARAVLERHGQGGTIRLQRAQAAQ